MCVCVCVCAHAKSLQSCRTLCNPMDCSPPDSCPWDSPCKNIGAGCHNLFQGIFLNQGLNLYHLCFLHFHVGFLVTVSISIFTQLSVSPFVISSLALSLNIFIKHTNRTVGKHCIQKIDNISCSDASKLRQK